MSSSNSNTNSVQLPISFGQTVAPQTWWNIFSGNSMTVNMGKSSAPAVEPDVLEAAGSYGHQLGTLGDALAVLLRVMEATNPAMQVLGARDRKILHALRIQLAAVEAAKQRHGRGEREF